MSELMVALRCLLRNLPLFFSPTPRTPLRVLCVIALDTVHVLRHGRPMPRPRRHDVAMFLDLAACANAAWDGKALCFATYATLRQRLDADGLGRCVGEYLTRLRALEMERPSVATGPSFDDVRAYREAVVRLSLGTATGIALDIQSADEAIRTTVCDRDVETLFRIAIQCQVIDDVIDYKEDVSRGLSGFLTASASLPAALDLTRAAARGYGRLQREEVSGAGALPLRLALATVTALARVLIRLATSLIATPELSRGTLRRHQRQHT